MTRSDDVPGTKSTRVDIPLLLPAVTEVRDRCIHRLVTLMAKRPGVEKVHVVMGTDAERDGKADSAQLCLHYDPERITLAQISEIARLAGADLTGRFGHAIIPFRFVGAEDQGRRLETIASTIPGITDASVNLAGQIIRLEYDKTVLPDDKIRPALTAAGFALTDGGPSRPPAPGATKAIAESHAESPPGDPGENWYVRNRELAWSATAGVFTMAGWVVGRYTGMESAPIALFLVAYFFGSRDNLGHLFGDLRKGHFHFNIDLLMVVAAAGAAVLGEWFEGALLLFLFSLGHALEHYAMGRARNAIKALGELIPNVAIVIRDGKEIELPIAQVVPGDRAVIKPGSRVSVDGKVVEGESSINQAPITGESVPVDKKPGDPVFAGTVNGEAALVVEVTAASGDRTLDRVIRLVAEAETQKAPTQQFTDKFERIFVPLILIGDLLLIVVPPLIGWLSWSDSFYRAMAVLVASSPCALALGTPAAVLAGIAQAARNGVLIKGGAYLETLASVDVLALDKTGTITIGKPTLTDVVPFEGIDESELLSLAAAVERRSQHPLAKAIIDGAEARSLTVPVAKDVTSVTGKGIHATIQGSVVTVGRELMFAEQNVPLPGEVSDAIGKLQSAGRTTVIVRTEQTSSGEAARWLGVLGIADEPRPGIRETLAKLNGIGVGRIVMLTGDNESVGKAVGDAIGISEVRAGLLPEDKVTAIRELAFTGRVAMIGDGVNDAPALAHASIGIAMGGAGSAAALETADIALMGDNLDVLPFAIGLSRRAKGVIRQNLFISLGVIVGLVAATVTGFAGIGVAVVVHEGSTLVVVANALRLLAYRGPGDS